MGKSKKEVLLEKEIAKEEVDENIPTEQEVKVATDDKLSDNETDHFNEQELKEICSDNVNDNIEKEQIISSLIVKKEEKEGKHISKKLILIIICISILVLAIIFSTIFALITSSTQKIISGVSIKGVDISGLTIEEANKKVNELVDKKLAEPFDIIHDDIRVTIIPEQFDASFNVERSVNTAFERGRGKNIFVSNFQILSSLLFKVDISPSFSYNEIAIDKLISEIENNFTDKLVQPSYYIDGKNLIITKGVNGVKIDSNALKLSIISNLSDISNENEDIIIPIIETNADSIDIEKIYAEVYKEPKDAYFKQTPFTIYPHEVGVDFAISIDEAKELLKEDKESYTIPLKFTNPKVMTNQIGDEAFPDLLAKYSTTYSTKNVNRSTNIRLASSKINGTVIMPGEVFSYNSTVGQRTAAAGFKEAGVYAGGEVTTDIGGGICQVSSTLYNSVLLSNLEIVERYNHGFNPGYVPAGRDATVSWGGPDFKFKNSRNFPVKIVCDGSGGTIVVEIHGVKETNEYEVEIQSQVTSYIQYKTIEKNDPSLPSGQTKVIESGSNGCRSVCYRILKLNGSVVSKTLLSTDTYNPHNRVVAVGTKKASSSTPSASVTTNTSPVTPQPTEESSSSSSSSSSEENSTSNSSSQQSESSSSSSEDESVTVTP